MEKAKMLELFWQRSEKAIEAAQQEYGALCRSIARNLLGNEEDVEECLNDTWHALWNAIPPQKPENLGAYAVKITRNLAMKRLSYHNAQKRKALTISFEELNQCISSNETPQQLLEHKELVALLEAFLRELDQESRDLFLRRYWFFDSAAQIADTFGYSQTKVTTRLYRLRKKLKAYLAKEGQIYVK